MNKPNSSQFVALALAFGGLLLFAVTYVLAFTSVPFYWSIISAASGVLLLCLAGMVPYKRGFPTSTPIDDPDKTLVLPSAERKFRNG